MKLYQLILAVPDDFNPDESTVSLQSNSKGEITVTNEGFIGPVILIQDQPVAETVTNEEVLY